MARVWSPRVVLAVNLLLLFFAFNPWLDEWAGQALMVIVIELALLVVVGLPLVLYQVVIRKKTLRQSVRDSVETVMDFLCPFGKRAQAKKNWRAVLARPGFSIWSTPAVWF
jgi:hypothetical protein